ncbi:alkaline phosphatase [Georgenia sunbinii]|uniref:alkaline phosphatase n=1 Tax=Georgenia sunbinii TaxID=3117728 RepID=UPI002F264A07
MKHATACWARRGLVGVAVTSMVAVTAAPVIAAPEGDAPAEPANVIVLIGDGMGYNHVANTNLYETGQSDYQVKIDTATGVVERVPGEPVQVFESWDLRAMTSFQHGNSYEPDRAWTDHNYVNESTTDSAAAATAMGTGVKTNNGVIGLDHEGNEVENLVERAAATGRSAGLVTSVPFNHATPAGYVAHNADRNAFTAMGTEMIDSSLDVVMGAGHPGFDDSNQPIDTPRYDYLTQADHQRLLDGQTNFDYIEDAADFEALAAGENVPETVFGLAQVASTLQQGRASAGIEERPYDAPLNENVPTLETMTAGALNVLEQNEDGFFLMVEGGAIDWTGHANDTVRNIEETQDFNASVEAVVDWVESEDSSATWDNTMVVVTADHETGYLGGPDEDPNWTEMTGQPGRTPTVGWYSGGHTNQVVPVWSKGAGTDALFARANGTDPVRGDYIDNTDLANVLLEDLWLIEPADGDIPVEAVIPDAGSEGPGALALSVADGSVTLGDLRNAGDRLRLAGELPSVSVTDSRAEGAGWSVAGQSSDLVDGSRTVRGSNLGWTPGLIEAKDGVTAGARVMTELSGGEGLSAPATLGSADAQGRVGTSRLDADLELEVPVDTRPGTYQGAITVTLFPVD